MRVEDIAPGTITIVITLTIAWVIILRGPLGQALARRLGGPPPRIRTCGPRSMTWNRESQAPRRYWSGWPISKSGSTSPSGC